MEQIKSIEQISERLGYGLMSGYAITTDKQIIKMLIDDESSCCENWGYFLSEDDPSGFVGANLLDVTLTDTALNTHKLVEYNATDDELDAGGIIFVNVHTSKGLLQFTAYNSHNGYYGHEVKITSNQLNHSEYL